jgi:hypothetical protein
MQGGFFPFFLFSLALLHLSFFFSFNAREVNVQQKFGCGRSGSPDVVGAEIVQPVPVIDTAWDNNT